MHVEKEAGDSAGILSFLGGNRKIDAGAQEKKESIFGNIGSAIRFTLLLSLLLWWIPIIGQAVAGYVGGRKAGTAARGTAAALVSVVVLIGVVMVISSGIIGGFNFMKTDPSELVAAVGMDFPLLGSLFSLILMLIQSAFSMLTGKTATGLSIYVIIVVFGLVGGAIAEQHAKEAARKAKDSEKPFIPRSLAAYVKGKKLGYENFDDRLSIQQSSAQEPKSIPARTLVRGTTAREEPKAVAAVDVTPAVQEAEKRESPFAGLIHRAEKNDPERERVRHTTPADDLEYV